VQISQSAFVLRFAPTNTDCVIDGSKIRAFLKPKLGKGATIAIKPIAALGPSASGKFLTTANHFKS
jgi:hypothetical protein